MLAPDYRPHLDGVRAIAVAGVVVYHLGLPLPGGFLGVDVFFVLSGFLITALLLEEHGRTGRIALGRFWARRARRLLPALILVVSACAVMAHRGPYLDLAARRGDMLATLGYVANWHFIRTDQSYFAGYTGASPLRHMWSLAIEEQFYLLWPLVVLVGVAAARRPRLQFAALLLGTGVSAVWMAVVFQPAAPSRAYLDTGARAHELLIGATVAVALTAWRDGLSRARAQRLLGVLSPVLACAIGIASLGLHDDNPAYFHGGSTIFAGCVAVWLLTLDLRPSGRMGHFLSTRPLVWLGMISYGLYLWHWPLALWLRESPRTAAWSTAVRDAITVILTVALAAASYYLVERPIRAGSVSWVGSSPIRMAAAAPAAVVATALFTLMATANPASSIAEQVNDTSVTACPPDTRTGWCVRRDADDGQPFVAVVGDSTSLALDPGMRALAGRNGWGYAQAGSNGCSVLPLPFPSTADAAGLAAARQCAVITLPNLRSLVKAHAPEVWILADRVALRPVYLRGRLLSSGDPVREQAMLTELHKVLTIMTSGGAKVVIVETPPPGEPVDCAVDRRRASCGDPANSVANVDITRLNQLYRRAASEFTTVQVISITDLLCRGPHGQCGPTLGPTLVRYDGIHYTATFSRALVPQIAARAGLTRPRS